VILTKPADPPQAMPTLAVPKLSAAGLELLQVPPATVDETVTHVPEQILVGPDKVPAEEHTVTLTGVV
jgi:hypothetical protein